MFIYEICSNLKIVHISNLFIYEKCSYMKYVHIWKLFIFHILKIVHILNFVFNLKIVHISIFCSNSIIVHISEFVQIWKKRKRKNKDGKPLMPPAGGLRGPSCPRRQWAAYRRPQIFGPVAATQMQKKKICCYHSNARQTLKKKLKCNATYPKKKARQEDLLVERRQEHRPHSVLGDYDTRRQLKRSTKLMERTVF
jgi:hypothetical protein